MALASSVERTFSTLSALSRLAWAETTHPDGYLADLSEQLVRLLGATMASVGVIDHSRKSYRTISNYTAQRGRVGSFEQELMGAVIAQVPPSGILYIRSEVQRAYPLDWVLREQNAEGFVGATLTSASGDRIGAISIYFPTDVTVDSSVLVRLEVIAQRASAELGLLRAAVSVGPSALGAGAIGASSPTVGAGLSGFLGHGASGVASLDPNLLGSDCPSVPPPSASHPRAVDPRARPETSPSKSSEMYRKYFQLSVMGMAIVTLNGELLDVNPSLCEMLQRERGALLGTKWTDYCKAEDLSHERRSLIEIAEGKSDGFVSETKFVLPNSSLLCTSISVRCVRRADGRADYLTLLAQDLTSRRLIEEQLMHSQRLEAVGRLAGGIAHDFNNLLTAMLAYTDNCGPTGEPSIDEMVVGVRDAALRAANLTNQLLAFARRQVIEPKVLDLNQVISNSVNLIDRVVGEHIEVVAGSSNDLWKVRVDPGQLDQILVNLAVNARDAMPHGGRLLIGCGNLPRAQVEATLGAEVSILDYVYIVVADTGCGMSASALAHLFEPFYTTKESGTGGGLGLATCHGIVSQNGGQIRVVSAPGAGTSFRMYLPRYHSEQLSAPSVPPSSPVAATHETILLVEDDDMVRRVAVRVLRSRGFHVLSAISGVDALDVAREYEGEIDLLLTDLVMPKMNGDKLAKTLGPIRPDMRILFTSGYAEAAHDHGLGLGANFLQKPYTPRQLVERIRKILDR